MTSPHAASFVRGWKQKVPYAEGDQRWNSYHGQAQRPYSIAMLNLERSKTTQLFNIRAFYRSEALLGRRWEATIVPSMFISVSEISGWKKRDWDQV